MDSRYRRSPAHTPRHKDAGAAFRQEETSHKEDALLHKETIDIMSEDSEDDEPIATLMGRWWQWRPCPNSWLRSVMADSSLLTGR
ncbi:hypothetical protein INT43_008102 [Umbelopsis isabellina]|uniref:Uncharacterized protein n=1 Tax=Mortierella isabellina TaxID=91625 RepID=A0A8H7PD70_MORIS|nr:hypothetical protein INT43_008102 [Umbelopsis isabellina]